MDILYQKSKRPGLSKERHLPRSPRTPCPLTPFRTDYIWSKDCIHEKQAVYQRLGKGFIQRMFPKFRRLLVGAQTRGRRALKATGRTASLACAGISAAASFGECYTRCLSSVGSCVLPSPLYSMTGLSHVPNNAVRSGTSWPSLSSSCPRRARNFITGGAHNDKRRCASGILLQ